MVLNEGGSAIFRQWQSTFTYSVTTETTPNCTEDLPPVCSGLFPPRAFFLNVHQEILLPLPLDWSLTINLLVLSLKMDCLQSLEDKLILKGTELIWFPTISIFPFLSLISILLHSSEPCMSFSPPSDLGFTKSCQPSNAFSLFQSCVLSSVFPNFFCVALLLVQTYPLVTPRELNWVRMDPSCIF